jgi:hypothetical protein
MTVFIVETYVVKPDKLGEAAAFFKKFLAWMKERSDLFKEVKSLKLFSNMSGVVGYVDMLEFDSLADLEKWTNRYYGYKEALAWHAEWLALIVPGTWSVNIWTAVQ